MSYSRRHAAGKVAATLVFLFLLSGCTGGLGQTASTRLPGDDAGLSNPASMSASINLEALEEGPLVVASRDGDITKVKQLIEEGAQIDQQTKDVTALWVSSALGHGEVVEVLLEAGADVDMLGPNGVSPLLAAAEAGFENIVILLVENGANINARDSKGQTALILAVVASHPRVAEVLVAEGSQVDDQLPSGITALFAASFIGDLELVKILLGAGASVDLPDVKGATPLFVAAQEGHDLVIHELLQSRASPRAARNDGATPLHAAAAGCHRAVIEQLLGYGANPDALDSDDRAPAAHLEDEKCIDGHTYYNVESILRPLFHAAREGHAWVAARLIELGHDVNSVLVSNGMTPLHVASAHLRSTVVKVLIESGAVKDMKDANGDRPIDVIGIERSSYGEESLGITQLLGFPQQPASPRPPDAAEVQMSPSHQAPASSQEESRSSHVNLVHLTILIALCVVALVVVAVIAVFSFWSIRYFYTTKEANPDPTSQLKEICCRCRGTSAYSYQENDSLEQASDVSDIAFANPLRNRHMMIESPQGCEGSFYGSSPYHPRSSSRGSGAYTPEVPPRRHRLSLGSEYGSNNQMRPSSRNSSQYSPHMDRRSRSGRISRTSVTDSSRRSISELPTLEAHLEDAIDLCNQFTSSRGDRI